MSHRRLAAALALLLFAAPAPAGPEPAAGLRPVLGRIDKTLVKVDDTLLDVAFEHRLGFEAVTRLNPEIDPWIPVPGTVVLLPTRYVLPRAHHEGLVINVPEMRLFDFTVPDGPEVFALAVGDQADPSIMGDFRVGPKRSNPTWNVPKSIRAKRPELPAQVPPGPENPLGSRWITIGHTSYGIHGTNVRWSIGRQATHGCLRLYEDEVQRLFDRVPEGTRIQIVYQPSKWGLADGRIYLEAHPDLYGLVKELDAAFQVPSDLGLLSAIDLDRARQVLEEARGIPVEVGEFPGPGPTSKPTS